MASSTMQELETACAVESYRMNEVCTDHGPSAALASLAMHHCNVSRVLLKPVCYLPAEVTDQRQWRGLYHMLSVLQSVVLKIVIDKDC